MRTFHIACRTHRGERRGRYLPAVLVLPITVGWLSMHAWGTHAGLRWGFYALVAAFAVYVTGLLVRVVREPVNYRSLRLSESGIEYKPLSNEQITIAWKDIEEVVFCREEAVFPDPGPYLETKWLIKVRGKPRACEVMDEWGSRTAMIRALGNCLPGFDMGEARRGVRSRREGKWLCLPGQASGG